MAKWLIRSACRLGGVWGRPREGVLEEMEMVIVEGKGEIKGEFGACLCNQWRRQRALPILLWEDLFLFTKIHKKLT